MLFAHFLTDEQIPHHITQMILEANVGPLMFLLIVNILLLLMGQFMEPSSVVMITVPLLLPIGMALGIDPIHLGVIMVVNMEIGMITPPVGLNLFVANNGAKLERRNSGIFTNDCNFTCGSYYGYVYSSYFSMVTKVNVWIKEEIYSLSFLNYKGFSKITADTFLSIFWKLFYLLSSRQEYLTFFLQKS